MRAAHILLATCLASARAFPIAMGNPFQRRSDETPTTLQKGAELESPCPDLIDPKTRKTATYYYKGTNDQIQATQFVRDHWGLPECCNKLIHDCVEPPNPLPSPSPCPQLTDDENKPLQFYINAYTTYQFLSNYAILNALMNNECKLEPGKGSASSPPALPNNLDTMDVATLPADSDLITSNGNPRIDNGDR